MRRAALDEERFLVEAIAAHDVTEAGRVGERDGDDAVALPRCVRELESLGGDDFDVEREPAQVAEAHVAERCLPRQQQIGMRGVPGEEIRSIGRGGCDAASFPAEIAAGERIRPRREAREPGETARAVEPVQGGEPRRVLEKCTVGDEEERRERLARDDGLRIDAPVHAHVSPIGIEVTGEDAGRGVPPEDDGRAGVHAAECNAYARRMRRRGWWIAVVATLMIGCAQARLTFINATPGVPIPVPATTYRPEGPGPFPAVVLLHGCEGVSENSRRWAEWLRARGYLALVVDSWTPRGLKEACSFTVPDPPSTARFDDAIGALRYLHTLPEVDRRRVAIMGWSNGGVFSMAVVNGPSLERAVARGVAMPEPGYAAAIGIYPGGCDSLMHERFVRPVLVVIGDADDWTRAETCVAMAAEMRAKGADVSVELLAGAYHYFDFEGQAKTVLSHVGNDNKPGGCCGATVAYDAAADAVGHRRIAEFLGYHLRAR